MESCLSPGSRRIGVVWCGRRCWWSVVEHATFEGDSSAPSAANGLTDGGQLAMMVGRRNERRKVELELSETRLG